jgi:HEAT repeat protein
MWILRNNDEGGWMIDISESVESMSPYIVPLLVNTYEDTNAYWKNRHVAALGLMRANREKAEKLFIKHLSDSKESAIANAILELGIMRNTKAYNIILKYSDSPSDEVRKAVIKYLGEIADEESLVILNNMKLNDPNKEVREAAKYSLSEISRTGK